MIDQQRVSLATYSSRLASLPWIDHKAQSGVVTRSDCWLVAPGCYCDYRYGGKPHKHTVFPQWLTTLTHQVAEVLQINPLLLNSCNANRMATAEQDLYWHSDSEVLFRGSEVDRDTVIVSLSFGATREFAFRQKMSLDIVPTHLSCGTLLIMLCQTQDKYQHMIHKGVSASSSSTDSGELRYNLTWRFLRNHTKACRSRS